jgi:hypothetical protein
MVTSTMKMIADMKVIGRNASIMVLAFCTMQMGANGKGNGRKANPGMATVFIIIGTVLNGKEIGKKEWRLGKDI